MNRVIMPPIYEEIVFHGIDTYTCFVNLKDMLLHHEQPKAFHVPFYRIPLPVYVILRFFLATYPLLVFIFKVTKGFDDNPWIVFSNWSYILQILTLFYKASVIVHHSLSDNCKRPDQTELLNPTVMFWYLKLKWILHNVCCCIPYFVTVIYWTVLWKSDASRAKRDPHFMFVTINQHALNSVIAFVDQISGALPTRVLHFYQPLAFLFLYICFTVGYYMAGYNDNIYTFLDWSQLGQTFVNISVAVWVVILCHLIPWLIKKWQHSFHGHPKTIVSNNCNTTINSNPLLNVTEQ